MGNMYVEVIDKRSIKEYQLDILSDNNIRLFLPMTFMESGDEEILSYIDGEGYVKLKDVDRISVVAAIDMIGMLSDGIRDAADNYIFPEEYEVDEDTVFVNKDINLIRLLFRPSKENAQYGFLYPEIKAKADIITKTNTLMKKEVAAGAAVYLEGSRKGAPPGPLYERVRALADLLALKVGEDAAGPVWEAARLFRRDWYGPAAALQELAKLRHRVWSKYYQEE